VLDSSGAAVPGLRVARTAVEAVSLVLDPDG
jgi:hypothetical protein